MDYQLVSKISDLDGTESGLYKIVFSDGNHYVGRSVEIKKRLYAHAGAFRQGRHKNSTFNECYENCGEPQYYFCEVDNELEHEKTEIWNTAPNINNRIPSKNIIQHKTSQYRGVSWGVTANKWRARYRNKHIGFFESEKDARSAYLQAKGE